MSQTIDIHHQALVDAIGMENTTRLVHGYAELGFYMYINFQMDALLSHHHTPSMEDIFSLLKPYPEEDPKIVAIKELSSLEQVLTHIEERIAMLESSNWELLDQSEDSLMLFRQLMASRLTKPLENWKDSITR